MDDLISRQEAIDAVYKRIKQIGYEDNPYVLSIRQTIRDLPPVQLDIVRCKDCAYGEKLPNNIRCELNDYLPFDYEDFCSIGVKRVTGR